MGYHRTARHRTPRAAAGLVLALCTLGATAPTDGRPTPLIVPVVAQGNVPPEIAKAVCM